MYTFYPDKMKQFVIKKEVMISEIQANSLLILKSKGVNVSQFIRQAIKEKHQRRIKNDPNWLYE